MTCQEFREQIPGRDVGDLSSLEQQRLDQHLAACEACRAFRDRFGRALSAAKQWQPPAPDREAILEKIDRSVGRSASLAARPRSLRSLVDDARRAPMRTAWRVAPMFAATLAASLVTVAIMRFVETKPLERIVVLVRQADGSLAAASPEELAAWRDPRAIAAVTPIDGRAVESATPAPIATPQARERVAESSSAPTPRTRVTPAPTPIVVAVSTAAPVATSTPVLVPTPSPEASPAAAYARAERSLDDPLAAADLLEQIVARWPASPEATTSRLELARLYAGPLDRPGRAMAQLNVVLASDADPGTRKMAAALRCRLSPDDCTNSDRRID